MLEIKCTKEIVSMNHGWLTYELIHEAKEYIDVLPCEIKFYVLMTN